MQRYRKTKYLYFDCQCLSHKHNKTKYNTIKGRLAKCNL